MSKIPKNIHELYYINSIGCWIWKQAINWAGYGIAQRGIKPMPAHRWVYQELVEKLPDNIHLHHKLKSCKRSCVNPNHMEKVTQQEHNRIGGRAIINIEIAREIRRLYKTGIKQLNISTTLNVPYHIVRQVTDNKSWRE